jgi:2-polyprenyl-6-methoxyphenol hydroxylase-like FAD-dependent oxidoreductase
MTFMRQAEFLTFLVAEASRYPACKLVMGANVRELVESDGVVRGVRYQAADGWHEIRALLTVGADGRFSQVRQLSNLSPPCSTSSRRKSARRSARTLQTTFVAASPV